MEFSVPTNWQEDLLEGLAAKKNTSEIKEVYGKLALDAVGGGRLASALAMVSKKAAKEHIRQLHNQGLKFNYLLNALCLDNLEFTRWGQRKLRHLLDWLVEIGVDSVTVANPYIAIWIKKNYPDIPLTASAMANINSVNRAKFWQDLGIEKITFPGQAINRDFALIRLLKKSLKCKIQLIANNACLCHCPLHMSHSLMNAHASQSWHKCRGYMFDYHIIMCRLKRLKDPINFIRADWIRPEDIGFYEDLGVDGIKLVDRRLSSDKILNIVEAYLNRSYPGNLLDLFHTFQAKSFNSHKGWARKTFYLRSIFSMNPLKILRFSDCFSRMEVYIDNQKLDTFLQNMPKECDLVSCDKCGYCRAVTDKAVRIDEEYLKLMLYKYSTTMDALFKDGMRFL